MQDEQKSDTTENSPYRSGGEFQMKIGKTTYEVSLFYNQENADTMDDRIKQMIEEDVKKGNF